MDPVYYVVVEDYVHELKPDEVNNRGTSNGNEDRIGKASKGKGKVDNFRVIHRYNVFNTN